VALHRFNLFDAKTGLMSRLRSMVRHFLALALLTLAFGGTAEAASTQVTVPAGLLAGMHPIGTAKADEELRVVIELKPRADLDALAAAMIDPANPQHRQVLSPSDLMQRFGRDERDGLALKTFFQRAGASDIFIAPDRLVAGGIMSVAAASRAFGTHFIAYAAPGRTAIAPAGPLTVPLAGVRDVHGTLVATTPRLADDVQRPTFTLFRGNWYTPVAFREHLDAVPDGGFNQRITLIEDASDHFDPKDVAAFLSGEGAPPGATMAHVIEESYAFKSPSVDCGRDDRGQEAGLDADTALTMAPLATIVLQYDDVCTPGNDGTLALARALGANDAPTEIVFPFAVGPTPGSIAANYGPPSIPMLEAVVRGIPLVVPSGDDGAFGYRFTDLDPPGVAYPCVSTYVICAGGTQVGDRDGVADEAPWNDGDHATGGGISTEPRPAWQDAASSFEFSPAFVKNRIVPDVSADAGGHLRIFWHGYGMGGIGGTSESASIVAAELAAINSLVPAPKRLLTVADLYALAKIAPTAFRDVSRENDRGYIDNTLRPLRNRLPKGYRGIVPPTPKAVNGCPGVQPAGCSVRSGFDAVTGLGSLKENAAVAALIR